MGKTTEQPESLGAILADRIEAAAERKQASLENALSHCREYAEKIERENEEGETRLDAEEIIATVDNEFAGIRPARAPGNAAAMREALERIVQICHDLEPLFTPHAIQQHAEAALAAPARNCDVGTKEEQKERFKAFCEDRDCCKCPFYGNSDCPLEWALAPFAPAEGGVE